VRLTVNNYLLRTAESGRSSASLLYPAAQFPKSLIQQAVGLVLLAVCDQHVKFIARYYLRLRMRDVTSRSHTFPERESKGTWLCLIYLWRQSIFL